MMFIMVGSLLFVFLPTWFGFAQFGNHGLWLAFTLFMAARGAGMHFWFKRLVSSGTLIANG
jgi:MATE family multidrug resistance protein